MNFGGFNFNFDANTIKNVAANASKHMGTAAKKMETVTRHFSESDIGKQMQLAREKLAEEYNATFSDMYNIFVPVTNTLYVMDYPDRLKAERLATKLNEEWREAHLIFNMSERTYNTAIFTGEVVDVQFRGLPAPPLQLLISLSMSARQWLASNARHILVVHCFKGYTRSAVFLSCYLTHASSFANTKDAIGQVSRKLKIDQSTILASQWRYLEYFDRILSDEEISPKALKIAQVAVHGITLMDTFYIEVWQKGSLLCSVDEKEESRDGDSVLFDLRQALAENTGQTEDVLVRVRVRGKDNRPTTLFRFAYHCAFVSDDFLHLSARELDNAAELPSSAFVDVVFDRCTIDENERDDIWNNFARARSCRASVGSISNERKFDEELEALQKEIGSPASKHRERTSLEEMFDDFDDMVKSDVDCGNDPMRTNTPMRVSICTPTSTPRDQVLEMADDVSSVSSLPKQPQPTSDTLGSPQPAPSTVKVTPLPAQSVSSSVMVAPPPPPTQSAPSTVKVTPPPQSASSSVKVGPPPPPTQSAPSTVKVTPPPTQSTSSSVTVSPPLPTTQSASSTEKVSPPSPAAPPTAQVQSPQAATPKSPTARSDSHPTPAIPSTPTEQVEQPPVATFAPTTRVAPPSLASPTAQVNLPASPKATRPPTTPAQVTPAPTTPSPTTPAQAAPAPTTPAQATPVMSTPAQATPVMSTPAQAAPAPTPAQATPVMSTPPSGSVSAPAPTKPLEAELDLDDFFDSLDTDA